MESIEFIAVVRDGHIELPEEFKDAFIGRVRVTVTPEPGSGTIERLLRNPIPAKNFRPLTRDEAHVR